MIDYTGARAPENPGYAPGNRRNRAAPVSARLSPVWQPVVVDRQKSQQPLGVCRVELVLHQIDPCREGKVAGIPRPQQGFPAHRFTSQIVANGAAILCILRLEKYHWVVSFSGPEWMEIEFGCTIGPDPRQVLLQARCGDILVEAQALQSGQLLVGP